MSKIRLSHKRNNIVLVGHMGSGKTSIGRNLSKKSIINLLILIKKLKMNPK